MSLGERLKQLRTNNNLSVRQLAQQVGVTASFIYQLEQSKVSPSFSTLKSIAAALDANMSLLIEDELPEDWVIVRKGNRKRLACESDNVKLEMLAFLGTRNKKMQPLVFELGVGEKKVDLPSFTGTHEDFIYILRGKVEVSVNNKKYVLEKDDAAYFIFNDPSSITNIGEEEAAGLWVVSPPGI